MKADLFRLGSFSLCGSTMQEGADSVPDEVQIFAAGPWKTHPAGPFTIDESFVDQVVANFEAAQKSGAEPFIDLEHETALVDPTRAAAGWVKGLRKQAGPHGVDLFAKVEWTDRGKQAIAAKHFRFVSPGWRPKDRDRRTGEPVGARLNHLSLTKDPFFEGMKPLTASLFPGLGRADGEETMHKNLITFLASAFAVSPDVGEADLLARVDKEGPRLLERLKVPQGLQLTSAAMEALTVTASTSAEDVSAAIVALAGRAAAGDKLEARVKLLEDEKIVAAVAKARAEKRISPAEEPEQLELARKDFPLWQKLIAKREPMVGELPELGKTENKLGDRLAKQEKALATWQAANPGKTLTDAYLACAEADPELFKDVRGAAAGEV